MHRVVVEFSSHLLVLFECSASVFSTKNESSIFPANLCDSSCNHRWPLTLAPSSSEASLTCVVASSMWMAWNTELADVYSVKVLVLDSNGTDRRSIYETRNSSRFHICEVDHGWLNLLVTRVNSWAFIKIFRFWSMGVIYSNEQCSVERLKRTKIQVCISIIFNDYMTLNILNLSTRNILQFGTDVRDKLF